MKRFRYAWVAAGLLLAACGGGGSGGSGSVATPAPTLTPVPSATPTPVPSATPTPVAVRYTVEDDGPLIGILRFYPSGRANAGDFREVYTNRAGVFRADQSDSIGPAFGTYVDYRPVNALSAGIVDPRTRFLYLLRAPVGATTVSPLTTLIHDVGDQALVLAALQLRGSGPDTLPAAIDPLVYSASQEVAGVDRPVLGSSFAVAANIRVLSLWQAGRAMESYPGVPGLLDTQGMTLANFIRANPQSRLFTQEGTEAYLRDAALRAGTTGLRPEVLAAAARLVNGFGPPTLAILNEPSLSSAYLLAIQGVLFPRLRQLIEANTPEAAARADALSARGFAADVAQFGDLQSQPAGPFYPGPDFVRIKSGSVATISSRNDAKDANYGDNDIFVPALQSSDSSPDKNARSVSKPQRYASTIAAELLSGGDIRVRASPNSTGIAYVDYQVQPRDGITETGRIWIIIE